MAQPAQGVEFVLTPSVVTYPCSFFLFDVFNYHYSIEFVWVTTICQNCCAWCFIFYRIAWHIWLCYPGNMATELRGKICLVGTSHLSSKKSTYVSSELILSRDIFVFYIFFFFCRSLAELSRIPVVVTNQVRYHTRDEECQFSFQGSVVVQTHCKILCIYTYI